MTCFAAVKSGQGYSLAGFQLWLLGLGHGPQGSPIQHYYHLIWNSHALSLSDLAAQTSRLFCRILSRFPTSAQQDSADLHIRSKLDTACWKLHFWTPTVLCANASSTFGNLLIPTATSLPLLETPSTWIYIPATKFTDSRSMEELNSSQRTQYAALIDEILAGADLTTVSEKKIRNAMTERLGYDLSAMKKAIGALIGERFDAMAKPNPGTVPVEANGHSSSVKREASVSNTYPSPNEDSDVSAPSAKKQRKQPDNDAKLAAKLQAEENSRARPTRGGGPKKVGPLKKKKNIPKRKSEKKIKVDDDSDMEIDSDGEKKERPKTGAFHKEYALSESLAELVHETQLSRPQVVKKIWEHIKALNLQDPDDKRQILCDDKMYAVFKQDKVHMFTMNKLLGKQLYPLEEA